MGGLTGRRPPHSRRRLLHRQSRESVVLQAFRMHQIKRAGLGARRTRALAQARELKREGVSERERESEKENQKEKERERKRCGPLNGALFIFQ